MKLALVSLTTFLALACSSLPDNKTENGAITPSQLLASAEYDSKRVEVRGWLRIGPEMRGLWDSKKDIENGNYQHACITIYNPRGISIKGPIREVLVVGTYNAKRPDRLIILGACSDAFLEIIEVRDQ